MSKRTGFAAIIAAAVMASCSTAEKTTSTASLNGEWNVEKIEGNTVKAAEGQDAPFIGFDTKENRIYGTTSCNRLTGALNADAEKGTIDLSALGSTRMMCPDMKLEGEMLGALAKVRTFKVDNDKMQLCDEKGNAVVELKKK